MLKTLNDIATVEEVWDDKNTGIRIECPVVMREVLRDVASKQIKKWTDRIASERKQAIEHYKSMPKDMEMGVLGKTWNKKTIIEAIASGEIDDVPDTFLKMGLQTWKKVEGKTVITTDIRTFDNRVKIAVFKEFFNIAEEDSQSHEKVKQ